jgi:hypothetical protein
MTVTTQKLPRTLKVSTWILAILVVVLAFNVSFQDITNVGASSQVVGEGTVGRIAVWTTATFSGPLAVTFTVNPNIGSEPLAVELKAVVSGGFSSDSINYTFWWDCANTTIAVDVASADPACGDPTLSANGAKFDGESATTKSVSHTYATQGVYTAKVIIERGTASPIQAQKSVTVNIAPLSVSCAVDKTIALVNEAVIWSTTVTGGEAPYVYDWSGSSPSLNTRTGPIESVTYSTIGSKIGQVRVISNDGQDSGIKACAGSPIQVVQIALVATPRVINPSQDSILLWNTEGFESCEIKDEDGNVIIPPGSDPDGSVVVSPTVTTKYTLTCQSTAFGTKTATDTVTVSGAPRFREIPPSGSLRETPEEKSTQFAGNILSDFLNSLLKSPYQKAE